MRIFPEGDGFAKLTDSTADGDLSNVSFTK